MRKFTGIIFIVFITFWVNNSWAQLSDKQMEMIEKQKKQIEEQQSKMRANMPAIRKPVGTYQAININEKQILLLNTTSGKFWLWEVKSNKLSYQNQIQEN